MIWPVGRRWPASIAAATLVPVVVLGVVPLAAHARGGAQAQVAFAPAASDSLDQVALRALVASGTHQAMRWSRLDDLRHSLRAVYDRTHWKPLWLQDGVPTPQARTLLAVLANAAAYGLNPTDFDAGRLPAQSTYLVSPAYRASFDVATTANAMRLLRAIREGRVASNAVHPTLHIPRPPFDVTAAVLALAASDDVAESVRALEPPFVHYALAKESLARLRALAAESLLTRLPPLPAGRALRTGDAWDGTPQLLRLLTALGDAPTTIGDQVPADSLTLTADVMEALRRFQARTGLEADGVLGRATYATVTRPVADKVRALELTLERWRWLPREFDAPPLIVNVPAFRLYAFAGQRDVASELLRMDVVVGVASRTRTPLFSDTLTTIVFAPYWDVPASILRSEILPAARRSATYLSRNRYEAVRGERDDSPVLGSGAEALAALEAGTARLRQTPGAHNALGLVKFLFPNPFNVYMHDTPAQSVFERVRRDASHGCIRLANPMGLVKWLLADDASWTDERIARAMAGTQPTYVRLRQPRPVYIVYATALATQDGTTLFYPDIYGFDDDLARRLAAGFPYAVERAGR